ncbi:c-type cytochrome [Neptuniibacter sp. QD48_55]|uniref:c-type cytochrome n=1 Tax=unclassified Neptuniibacter TaxID=2630693 RepID=UPI0039F4EEAF
MKLKMKLPLLVLPLLLGEAVYADSQATYQQKCMACHDNGVAGAPKMTDRGAWTARLAERGIEGLYTSALKGRKAMPPKGACFDCSDEQIKRVVDFMVKGN